MSLVLANESSDAGFLRDDRRINLTLTRSRHSFVIMCDWAKFRSHLLISDLLVYLESNAYYRMTVSDYLHIVGEYGNLRPPPESIAAAKKRNQHK